MVVMVMGVAYVPPADGQVLGTFRWRMEPYCNVISLTITQQGGQYTADGTDDQCGAERKASVRGMAFQNPDGSIGLGLSIVTTQGATPAHVDAVIEISTLHGNWADSAGNQGAFIFTTGTGGGSGEPRPVPHLKTRAGYSGGNQTVALSSAVSQLRSVVLVIPTPGKVIVNASGYFSLESTGFDSARCSITIGTLIDEGYAIRADDAGHAEGRPYLPFGATRGFEVQPGTFTVRLMCTRNDGSVSMRDTNLTAIFIPR